MAGDHRHLPERHVEALENIAGAGMTQRLDIVRRDPAEPNRSATSFRLRWNQGKLSTSVPSRSKITNE